MKHKHNYQLLDVEKRKEQESRYSTNYHRTTRLFCSECGEIKEIKNFLSVGINVLERPDWTFNI